MASNPVANLEQSAFKAIKGTAIPSVGTANLFPNARGNTFNNSTITTEIKGGTGSLEALYNRVAPNAILNAGGRADEVRCHPGTREEVIGRIEKWREDAINRQTRSRMFWLSGPAGAGKSAIVQTIAESWSSRGIHAANFFFFRTDASRNHAHSLVATLLYQIFDFYPEARKAVEEILVSKPRILEASLKQQFDKLVCTPFRSIGLPFPQSIVLLVDGLDECGCHSKEKKSQKQILQALEMLVSQNDLPFLVLVASRVEHQISMAFRQLSSVVDSTFLNEDYSPQEDIHLFVTAEFDRIKRTHRLAPSDASWPSASDVYGIVEKSSGQFIYAATVMRFISDSPAAPTFSLQKVQGVARIGSKSPFSQLDALYTYILAQADDQKALKDMLHASLFVEGLPAQYPGKQMKLATCLRIQDKRYIDCMIASCIADVAAVARFDNDRLIFYHASLADYLKNQARSGAHFFDEDAFNLKILPPLMEHQFSWIVAYDCLRRLKTVTLDIMRLCNTLDKSHISTMHTISHDRLTPLHDLCVRHGAVAEYRVFLYKWLTDWMESAIAPLNAQPLGRIPYVQRYMTMVQIDRRFGDLSQSPDLLIGILRPESASDGHEIAVWVQDLLSRMYMQYYPHHLGTYKQLLRQWTYWAVSNNVPFSNLHKVRGGYHHDKYGATVQLQDIPYGQRYITMARIEHINGDLTQDPNVAVDILHAGPATDAEETASWVQNLLRRIHREYYPHRLETYKRLIKQWISWAVSNKIPLSARQQSSANDRPSFQWEDIPYGRMYTTMMQIDTHYGDIWQNSNIAIDALHLESLSDAEEVTVWIKNLLRSINARFASDRVKYKQLIKLWIMWAVSNNIPLVELDGLPHARQYLFKGMVKRWTAAPFKFLLHK